MYLKGFESAISIVELLKDWDNNGYNFTCILKTLIEGSTEVLTIQPTFLFSNFIKIFVIYVQN